jgi:hypothetical protein
MSRLTLLGKRSYYEQRNLLDTKFDYSQLRRLKAHNDNDCPTIPQLDFWCEKTEFPLLRILDSEPLIPYTDPVILVPEYLQDKPATNNSDNRSKRVYSQAMNLAKKGFKIRG